MITFLKKEKNLAYLVVVVVFLALVRLLAECFRMGYVLHGEIPFANLKPLVMGALVCALAIFGMTLLLFRQKYKWMIALALLTVAVLVIIKILYRDCFIN